MALPPYSLPGAEGLRGFQVFTARAGSVPPAQEPAVDATCGSLLLSGESPNFWPWTPGAGWPVGSPPWPRHAHSTPVTNASSLPPVRSPALTPLPLLLPPPGGPLLQP